LRTTEREKFPSQAWTNGKYQKINKKINTLQRRGNCRRQRVITVIRFFLALRFQLTVMSSP